MDGSSSLAVSGISDSLGRAAASGVVEAPRAPVVVAAQNAPGPSDYVTEPATSPAAVSSVRSLDTLVEISPSSAQALAEAKAEVQSGAPIATLGKSQLNDISILDLSVSQIAGLSDQELSELLPST